MIVIVHVRFSLVLAFVQYGMLRHYGGNPFLKCHANIYFTLFIYSFICYDVSA